MARGNNFGPTTLSSSHIWGFSGFVAKSTLLFLVSWSTIVLSFRYSRMPFSLTGAGTKTITQQPHVNLRGNEETTELSAATDFDFAHDEPLSPHVPKDGPMKLSLWLIPPGGDEVGGDNEDEPNHREGVFDRIQNTIDDLSAELGSPRFFPHVTLVGGIKVDSETKAMALAEKLRTGLSGFGPVDCSFRDVVLSASDCWNQALVLELVPRSSETFLGLCKASRKILSMEQTNNNNHEDDGCLTFPPPLGVPHMSLYYGDSPPPPNEKYLSMVFGNSSSSSHKNSFRAHRVMLWKTDPSSAEGVPEWEPLADISLL
jgi:hypothetical protein